MKKNIRKVDINGNPSYIGLYWRWDETCDLCGKDCKVSNILHSCKPSEKGFDFCLDCARKYLDNK